jgi:hypothetical protein
MSTSLAKRPMGNLPAERRKEIALELLTGYAEGREVAEMAPDYGVSDVTAYALLIRDHEGEWKQAQESRALANKARASKDLQDLREQLWRAETAHDILSLARIREQVKLAEIQAKRAEWELERVMKRIYGQDQPLDTAGRLSITLNISGGNTTNAVQHGATVDEDGKPVA